MSGFLCNGINCFVKDLPFSNSVTLAFFLRVGLPTEGVNNGGISHFLEHMCFRGTATRTAYQITQQVDALGAQINAYTTKEFTCYYLTILPQYISEGLDILTDIVFGSLHNMTDIMLEKSIISEEIKMYEDSPDEKIMDLFYEALFRQSHLGRPILGTIDSINSFDSDELQRYYQHYFNPHNIHCVIAGALNGEEISTILKKQLESVPFREPRLMEMPVSSLQFKSNQLHVSKDLEQTHFCLGFPGIDYHHPDRFALNLLSTILGGSMSSRLFQSVREKSGLAYSIYSTPSFYSNAGALCIYAGTSHEHFNQAVDCVRSELSQLVRDGVTQEEFDRASCQLKGGIIIQLEGSSAWTNWLGRQFMYGSGMTEIEHIQTKINAIKMDDLVRLASDIIDMNKMVFVSLGPSGHS